VEPKVEVVPNALGVVVVPKGEPNVLVGLAPNKEVPVLVVADWPNENGVLDAPKVVLFWENNPVF